MEQPNDNSSSHYSDDNHSAPSPADSYQYNSSNSSINLQNLNSPTDGSNGSSSNDTNNFASLSNYCNANNYASYQSISMPQYYNMEKTNLYNQNLLANYHSNYQQAANLANYYQTNEIENNLTETERNNENKDTSITKSEHEEEENEIPSVPPTNQRSRNNSNNKKANCNYSNPSYLMQPPDSESIAAAAANASANRSKRRTRTKFDKKQLDLLEQAFDRAHYPDVNQIIHLSDLLNISTERISVWFQNRRARFKRSKKETIPSSSSYSTNMIEKQIKSILNNDNDDEDEDGDRETPLKINNNNNSINSSAKKNMIENMKSLHEIENQLSLNSSGSMQKQPSYPINYNQQQNNFNPYQISNLTNRDSNFHLLPIIKASKENSNGGSSNNESSSSITSTPSRSRSNTPESEEKTQNTSAKDALANIYNNYQSYAQFSLQPPGIIPYPHPPAISLTTPNGSTNALGRQYQPSLPGIGQIFQPFIDRSGQEESPYYGLNLTTNNNNNIINHNNEESNSTSPVSNSTRSRSASSSSSSENDNKENVNSNDEYENQSEKLYANHYSQMFAHSIQPNVSNAHFFNHLQQHQFVNQSNYNMNALKQSNLPGISQIFQPYAACGNNNQENNSYY